MKTCVSCGFKNKEGKKFCVECGAALQETALCPGCGAQAAPAQKFCGECGAALHSSGKAAVPPAVPQTASERKHVAVLFADINGFTKISEAMDAEAVTDFVNECFAAFSRPVEKFDGTVDKFMGDCIMAVFGAPRALEKPAEMAALAAWDIRNAAESLSQRFRERLPRPLTLSVGVHAGEVVAGGVGSETQRDYTVIGDVVNMAQRLQSAAGPNEIFVSREVHEAAGPVFEWLPKGTLELKGKASGVEAFALVRPLRRMAMRQEYRTPLIGREVERLMLKEVFERAMAGEGQIVGIVGEAGIGKTRLRSEIYQMAQGTGAGVFEGRCLPYGRTFSYWAINSVLRSSLGMTDDVSVQEVAARLPVLREIGLVHDDLACLAHMLGLESQDTLPLSQMDPETVKRKIFQTVKKTVLLSAQKRPVVLMFEDIQWVDELSLGVLEMLAEGAENAPVMLVTAYRPEFTPSWLNRSNYTQIRLKPLGRKESESLLRALLKATSLGPRLVEQITGKAEGNPFFMEETVQSLLSANKLARRDGGFELSEDFTESDIPTTVQALIAARIDQLDAPSKQVLQTAAVVGKDFTAVELERMAPEGGSLERCLRTLLQKEFIVERRSDAVLQYTFKHGLIQEIAYKSLLHKERRRLHQDCAVAMEALNMPIEIIAHHFILAENLEKGCHYAYRAAEALVDRFAYESALKYYDSCLALVERMEPPARLEHAEEWTGAMRNKAVILGITGRAREAEEIYKAYEGLKPLVAIKAKKGGILRMPLSSGINVNLDPLHGQTVVGAEHVWNVHAGLIRYGAGTDIHPALAEKWEVLEDGKRYRFILRENARFSNGRNIDAEDVKRSFERLLHPDFKCDTHYLLEAIEGAEDFRAGAAEQVRGIRLVDRRTVEISLTRHVAPFLYYFTLPETYILPKEEGHKKGEEWNRAPVGAGPFVLASLDEKHMHLRRNPHFFQPEIPHVEELRYDVVEGAESRGADLAPHTHHSQILRLEEGMRLHSGIMLNTTFLGIRHDMPPFNDRRVRQALNYAVNKEELNERIYGGHFAVARSIIPPGLQGHNPKQAGYPYSPERARALLKEAGHSDGIKTYYQKRREDNLNAEMLYLISALAQVGVEIEVVDLERATFLELSRGKDKSPLFFSGWYADYPDAETFLALFHSKNPLVGFRYHNPQYDALLDEAMGSRDTSRRVALYQEAERILIEDAPVVLLCHERSLVPARPHVKGLVPALFTPVVRPETLWLDK